MEAGGRNLVVKLGSNSGFPKIASCVGMLVFTHFWYWYPLIHFLNLSMYPSAIIGVNSEFKIPKSFEFKSNAKPSTFDYIPMTKEIEEKKD